MEQPVKITQEMKQQHADEIDKRIKRVNGSILRAVEIGKTCTCFEVDHDDPYYWEVRRIFEEIGYIIAPTGIIGGVMQTTETIIW